MIHAQFVPCLFLLATSFAFLDVQREIHDSFILLLSGFTVWTARGERGVPRLPIARDGVVMTVPFRLWMFCEVR